MSVCMLYSINMGTNMGIVLFQTHIIHTTTQVTSQPNLWSFDYKQCSVSNNIPRKSLNVGFGLAVQPQHSPCAVLLAHFGQSPCPLTRLLFPCFEFTGQNLPSLPSCPNSNLFSAFVCLCGCIFSPKCCLILLYLRLIGYYVFIPKVIRATLLLDFVKRCSQNLIWEQ